MTKFEVGVVVSRVYGITVEAESSDDAERKVMEMDAADISAQGNLDEVEIEHAEVRRRVREETE